MKNIERIIYIVSIILLLILCFKFWNARTSDNGTNSNQTLNDKFLDFGAALAIGQNFANLEDRFFWDLINMQKVEPCTPFQESTPTQSASQNVCEVKITKGDGENQFTLTTREGKVIQPRQTVTHSSFLYILNDPETDPDINLLQLMNPLSEAQADGHRICYSDLNGAQIDKCYPRPVVVKYCAEHNNNHPLCSLV